MATPDVSVIIPTYNRRAMLQRALQALEAQQLGHLTAEVVVTDDGSTDDTKDLLKAWKARQVPLAWRVAEKNGGPGRARELALPLARGRLVLFIGDDIVPDSSFIAAHVAGHRQAGRPLVAVLGRSKWPLDLPVTTVMRHIDGVGGQQFGYHYFQHGQLLDYRSFYTSNISVPRALLLEQPRLFDEDFTQYGYEDIELGLRLERQGLAVVYTALAVGAHYHPYSTRGFCDRQVKAGGMACVFAAKHREVTAVVGREALSDTRNRQRAWVEPALKWVEQVGGREEIERALIDLASFYEFREVPALDGLYFALFRYFYDRGMAEWDYSKEEADGVLAVLLLRDMLPEVQHFLWSNRSRGGPAPEAVFRFFDARPFERVPALPRATMGEAATQQLRAAARSLRVNARRLMLVGVRSGLASSGARRRDALRP